MASNEELTNQGFKVLNQSEERWQGLWIVEVLMARMHQFLKSFIAMVVSQMFRSLS
jgi:hypothetical protein